MSNSFNQTDIEIIESYSPEDWDKYLNTFAVEKHLRVVNKIFEVIGLGSLPNYLHLESKNLLSSYNDPTQSKHSLYTTALNNYFSKVKNIRMGDWVKLYEAIWIRFNAKKFDKLMIQAFMHLYSRSETNEAALKMYELLKRNDVYYGTIFNKKGSSYAIKSIQKIINANDLPNKMSSPGNSVNNYSSNNTIVFNNETPNFNTTINNTSNSNTTHNTTNHHDTTNNYDTVNRTINSNLTNNVFQSFNEHTTNTVNEYYTDDSSTKKSFKFAVFVYIHKRTSNIQKLSIFLYEKGFIKERKAFEELFTSKNGDFDPEKVVWLMELVDLCFLFRFFSVHDIIKDDGKWAYNVSNSFISEGKKKRAPEITSASLLSTNSKYKLNAVGDHNMEEWVKAQHRTEITILYRELRKLYY